MAEPPTVCPECREVNFTAEDGTKIECRCTKKMSLLRRILQRIMKKDDVP